MLEKFLDVLKSHPLEDELMCSVLRVGVCKAVAVLGVVSIPEAPDLMDRLKKSLESGLKSPCLLGSQTLTLHGVMYLLQAEASQLVKEVTSVFVPLVIDYLQTSLKHFTAAG